MPSIQVPKMQQQLTGPFLNRRSGRLPDVALQFLATSPQFLIFNARHVRGSFPVVGVGVAHRPDLFRFELIIIFPVSNEQIKDSLGRLDLLETSARVA